MAGLLDFLRRIAPGDAPVDPMAGSVMSRGYIPETSGRQLSLGGIRGLLDVSPVGLADAATQAINRANVPSLVALRAVTGKQTAPGDAMVGLLGQGGGAGYDAARSATQAVVPMMGLLGNQARGALPAGYARDQSGAIVWQGGPNKFEPEPGAPYGRLRSDYMGSGEGNAGFGDGLYVASNKKVAHSYATDMLAQKAYDEGRLKLQRNGVDFRAIFEQANRMPKSRAEYERDFKALVEMGELSPSDRKSFMTIADDILQARKGGYLYKIDLPDSVIGKMLDWDKKLAEQPDSIRNALKSFDPNMTGAEIVSQLGSAHSEKLRQMGIPGIRYLDRGSRAAAGGTSNFVIFPGEEAATKVLMRKDLP